MKRSAPYDRWLLLAVLALLVVGTVMITSIGVPKSIRLSAPVGMEYPDCASDAVDCYLILKNHVMRVGVGLIAMLVAWKIPYRFWRKTAPLIYGIALALLVVVLVGGGANNGTFASSWINIPGVPFINSLQPSEIAKFGLIVFLSTMLADKMSMAQLQDWKEGFLKFALWSGAAVGLILIQPDMGSAAVLATIAGALYFLSGANWRHFVIGGGIGIFFGLIMNMGSEHSRERVITFFSPPEECLEEQCWQTRQANIAIGSGGFWGKGLTQGVQKSYWLPQATDDFIFAASAEELGFVRTAFLVCLYFVITYRGLQIARHAPNKFAMLVAAGISTWIGAQSFINIMVNTALFPITGITLPFMSYGGSSMVLTLLGVGVLLNISKETTSYAYTPDRRGVGRARPAQSRYRRGAARAYLSRY
jgi:cell division protein FtsW